MSEPILGEDGVIVGDTEIVEEPKEEAVPADPIFDTAGSVVGTCPKTKFRGVLYEGNGKWVTVVDEGEETDEGYFTRFKSSYLHDEVDISAAKSVDDIFLVRKADFEAKYDMEAN